MKLIIGLGNPEKKYEQTRHNAGFLIIEKLLAAYGFPKPKYDKKSDALVSKGEIHKKRAVLAMPQTYMNNSGFSARVLLDFYKLKPENLIIIHDDKDIVLGETRVQTNRGPAGHNGIKSIIEHIGTQNFTRIRIGVAPPPARGGVGGGGSTIKDTANFVLGKFTAAEKKVLETVTENITKQIEALV